jgi:hypothetical protein
MRTFVVQDLDKVIEPGLLLKEVGSAGLGWFLSLRSDACVYGGRFAEGGQVRFVQRQYAT